jgi:hypothetical protein
VDLVGQLRPLLQAVQGGHEGIDPVRPELRVGPVGHPAGEGGGVVLVEGLIPRAQMAPVAAVERPDHALARAHPVLEVRALVDVGHEPQGLGQALDDLGLQQRLVDRSRPPDVDGDLRQRGVAARRAVAAQEGPHHHGSAEVLAVLHPVERDGQARVVEVDRGGRLAERRQYGREVLGLCSSDRPELDDHGCSLLGSGQRRRSHGRACAGPTRRPKCRSCPPFRAGSRAEAARSRPARPQRRVISSR